MAHTHSISHEAPVTAVPGAPAAEEGGSVEVEMESAVAPEEMEE